VGQLSFYLKMETQPASETRIYLKNFQRYFYRIDARPLLHMHVIPLQAILSFEVVNLLPTEGDKV